MTPVTRPAVSANGGLAIPAQQAWRRSKALTCSSVTTTRVHAHDYYTDYLVRNSVNVPYQQSGKHTWEDYSHTRIANETLKFIEENKDRPFFCYAAWTPPHADYVIPDNAPFSDKPWPEEVRNYAAMVALVDKDVGRVMQKLKDLGLDDKTLVIFSSDNGANQQFIEPLGSTGGLRGYKRMLYEGGIRAPFIARWPGKIQPGTTSDLLTTFADFLPTAADMIGVPAPSGMDGISILPTLLGKTQSVQHDSLYFEIYEPYFQQSVRLGDWKGYRLGTKAPLELYDLKADPTEQQQPCRRPSRHRSEDRSHHGGGTHAFSALRCAGTIRERNEKTEQEKE